MRKLLLTLLLVLSTSLFTFCEGQYTLLHQFDVTHGEYPTGNLTLSGHNLFGVTWLGGANGNGCIFSIDTDGSNYKDLWDFNSITGESPLGSLILSGNKLYGMAAYGGANYSGCIFSIDTDGSRYIDIFDFNSTKGNTPQGGSLILSGNILYGMTEFGGTNNDGCIFSVDTNGGEYKKLLDFDYTNNPEGGDPRGSLTLVGGKLFGMTGSGGTNRFDGVIFSIDTNGNNYKILLDFNGTNGSDPQFGTLMSSNGRLYGMTFQGGVYDSGCIFSIDTNGTQYKDLLDFDGTKGNYPWGSLILIGKKLVGMASDGGMYQDGVIFSIDTNGNNYKYLYDFNYTNGGRPLGSLISFGGFFYGTAEYGGIDSVGVVFKIDTGAVTSVNNIISTKGSLNVYPNPSSGIFTVALSHAELVSASQPKIEVYNILGEEVYSATLKQVEGDNTIDLSSQPNGIYLYRVIATSGELMGEGKVVIQK